MDHGLFYGVFSDIIKGESKEKTKQEWLGLERKDNHFCHWMNDLSCHLKNPKIQLFTTLNIKLLFCFQGDT